MMEKNEALLFLHRTVVVVHNDCGSQYSNVGILAEVTTNSVLINGRLGRVLINLANIEKIREVAAQ